MRDATVEAEHAPVAAEPVATLHVIGRPSEQQLTEAQTRHKYVGFVDLSALQVDPLERVAGVVNFYPLAGSKIARRDRGLSILRELAIELFPEVAVSRQVLSLLFPDELQRMPQSQVVDNGRPVQLQHPQRVCG